MKNLYKLLFIILAAAGLLWLILYGPGQMRDADTYEYSEDYVQTKELPGMLEFCYFSADEWEEKMAEEEFGQIVTPELVEWVLEQTGTAEYIAYDVKEQKTVSRAQWNELYEQLLDLLDEEEMIRIAEEVILKKEADTLFCGFGNYQCSLEGIELEPMSAMGFYIKEDRVIGIRSLQSASAALSNVYIKTADAATLQFLAKGGEYEIGLAVEEPEKVKGHVCDLLWEDGRVAKVQRKEDTIQGNLIAVGEDTIEIEGYGEIARSAELPVYKTYGTIEEKQLSDVVIANMKVEYVTAGNKVEAVLLTEPAQISRIRVLLLTEDGGYYRDDICLNASVTCKIVKKDGESKLKKKKVVKASELFVEEEANSIQIVPSKKKGKIYLCDASGKRISKGYSGTMDLRRYQEGFVLINEVLLEDYLCAVVPSEMPASYGMEALKAQAVCARSYAYIQMGHGDFAAFGAHVDDSTNYQVYNKQDRDEKTTAAVLDTAGMVIQYHDEIANAYYFSTSAGITGNGDAWNLTDDPNYDYLHGSLIKDGGGEVDLSSEEAFAEFIANPDPAAYESAMPYFRWKAAASYSSEEVQEKVREILTARKARTPQDIMFFDTDGQEADSVKTFGNLQKISIAKRAKSGTILEILLEYESGSVRAGTEYNVRAVLGAGVTELTLSDGSKREAALLPSAYTTLTPLEDGTYSMTGGGYGHGIGMSQNGAKAMADQGKSYEEILKFFYQDIEVAVMK